MELVYAPVATSIRALLRSMDWRVDVRGVEHVPARGPAVLAVNHISYLDPLVMVEVTRRRGRYVRFLGKHEVFESPLIGALLRQMQHIPVQRGRDQGRALEAAERLLLSGELVCLYPEATISTSFVPMTLRPGAAQLALRTGAPLIPVATFGAHRLSTKHRPRRWRRGIAFSVVVGAPMPATADEPTLTARLGERLRGMVDDLVATYPQRPAGDADGWWVPAHLGGTAPSVDEAEALRRREHLARVCEPVQDRRTVEAPAHDDAPAANGRGVGKA